MVAYAVPLPGVQSWDVAAIRNNCERNFRGNTWFSARCVVLERFPLDSQR